MISALQEIICFSQPPNGAVHKVSSVNGEENDDAQKEVMADGDLQSHVTMRIDVRCASPPSVITHQRCTRAPYFPVGHVVKAMREEERDEVEQGEGEKRQGTRSDVHRGISLTSNPSFPSCLLGVAELNRQERQVGERHREKVREDQNRDNRWQRRRPG